jgi:3-hydroxybutyryl-CoA dehydrogenase
MALDEQTVVGVVGAGAMGTGIAQVAAAAGHRVVLGDAVRGATQKAQANIGQAMDREVQKSRLSRDAADEVMSRIDYQWEPLGDESAYKHCGLVIEAIVEDLTLKQTFFAVSRQSCARSGV